MRSRILAVMIPVLVGLSSPVNAAPALKPIKVKHDDPTPGTHITLDTGWTSGSQGKGPATILHHDGDPPRDWPQLGSCLGSPVANCAQDDGVAVTVSGQVVSGKVNVSATIDYTAPVDCWLKVETQPGSGGPLVLLDWTLLVGAPGTPTATVTTLATPLGTGTYFLQATLVKDSGGVKPTALEDLSAGETENYLLTVAQIGTAPQASVAPWLTQPSGESKSLAQPSGRSGPARSLGR